MKNGSILRRLTERAGLPAESLPGVPLLELSGDDRILIENHECVIGYSDKEIEVRTKFGLYKISGDAMVLACVQKEQLVIHGKVDSILLIRGR